MGTRIVPDRVPGEERAGNGGPGVLTLAGVPIGQAEDAPARLADGNAGQREYTGSAGPRSW